MKNDLVRTKCMVTTEVSHDVRFYSIKYYDVGVNAFVTHALIRTRKQFNDELRSIYWAQLAQGNDVDSCIISYDTLVHITAEAAQ